MTAVACEEGAQRGRVLGAEAPGEGPASVQPGLRDRRPATAAQLPLDRDRLTVERGRERAAEAHARLARERGLQPDARRHRDLDDALAPHALGIGAVLQRLARVEL